MSTIKWLEKLCELNKLIVLVWNMKQWEAINTAFEIWNRPLVNYELELGLLLGPVNLKPFSESIYIQKYSLGQPL